VIAVVAAAAVVAGAGLQVRIDERSATIRDQRTRVETTQTRTHRSVAVPSDVLFAFDSARLTARGRATLRDLELGDGPIRVTGHTDARGSATHNRALSLRRARAVAAVLRSGRVRIVAAGESQPVASNRAAAGRARNRRVEISLG
jgi:outer membrane protein OmpA-like peptidoglycan-associated protein